MKENNTRISRKEMLKGSAALTAAMITGAAIPGSISAEKRNSELPAV